MPQYSEGDSVSRLSEILASELTGLRTELAGRLEQELERILAERFRAIARQVGAELEAVRERARGAPDRDWAALPIEERRHLEAQRFARVKAAEIRLYQAEAVARGRVRRNLYNELNAAIDSARQTFGQEYQATCSSMKDYLHLELVRVLAQGDAALLGPEYPGPLV